MSRFFRAGLLKMLISAVAVSSVFWAIPVAGSSRALRDQSGTGVAPESCPSSNPELAAWLNAELSGDTPLLPQSTNFDDFLLELKTALDKRWVQQRPVEYIFGDSPPFHPTCTGHWLEFGVYTGSTINIAANSRHKYCGTRCPPVFGFDTFTGLPEEWVQDTENGGGFEAGAFDVGGQFPPVVSNVELVKGLFSDSIPTFLKEQQRYAGGNKTISYLHIDCDLYAGTRDAFQLLDQYIVPGTVILFDDLVNYAAFKEHEVKAFWEWLQASGKKVLAYAIKGAVPGKDTAVDHTMTIGQYHWHHQSAAFVVVEDPAKPVVKSQRQVSKRPTSVY